MSEFILMFGTLPIMHMDITGNHIALTEDDTKINHAVYRKMCTQLSNFDKVITERLQYPTREALINILHKANINTLEQYAKSLYCINITDAFWVKTVNDKTYWNCINAFKNCMNTTIANAALNDYNLAKLVVNGMSHILTTPSPQYKLSGSADKCVKRTSNGLFMYKSCGELSSEIWASRPYSEWLVTRVYEKLDIPERYYVKYRYKEEKRSTGYYKPYSICPIFTNENTSLIEYRDTKFASKSMEELKAGLAKTGNNDAANEIRTMNVMDSLVLNIDRHDRNYGMLLDNKTFNYIGLAPIYDNDCALGSTIGVSKSNGSFDELYNILKNKCHVDCYNSINDVALRNMTLPMYKKLKSIGRIDLTKELNQIQGISQRRKDFIQYILDRRLAEILDVVDSYLANR